MQIWYFGITFLVIPMIGNSAIRAAGDTFIPSLIMIFSAGINIVLDPLLIFGIWFFPELGLAGAALATLIARAMTLVASLSVLKFNKQMLSSRFPNWQETFSCWRDILYVGLPAAGSTMITPISVGIITSLLAVYGSVTVAGFGVASRIESFALIVLFALGASISTFVGQNWGAEKYGRVVKALEQSYLFCLAWGALLTVLLAAVAGYIVPLFNDNQEVIAIAKTYLWIVPISYGAGGIIQVANSTFNALGNPMPSVIITGLRMIIFYIPLAYVASIWLDAIGVFIAATISSILAGIIAYFWSRKTCYGKLVER